MGRPTDKHTPLAWQSSLKEMKAYGTLLALSCTGAGCGYWAELNIETMILEHGPEWAAWGRRPVCTRCGGRAHYMASPGPTTPYRPCLPSPVFEAARREFLKSFGFTRRDIARIKALAERVAGGSNEASMNDLDVPVRVGAYRQGDRKGNGDRLGEWAGCDLLFWRMSGRELEHWQRRSRGPKGV